jgi:hypothetical protein
LPRFATGSFFEMANVRKYFSGRPSRTIFIAVGFIAAVVVGQEPATERVNEPISLIDSPKRARPPEWPIDVLDAFFADARQALVGTRPDFGARNRAGVGDSKFAQAGSSSIGRAVVWSKWIDAETLETEVKRLAQAVAADVTTAGAFKSGGYLACQRHFSMLAVLMGVTSEFDGAARWQDAAPGLRETFASAGHSASQGSDESFRMAVQRKQDLEELIRGARPAVATAERAADWGKVAGRPPLMQRLNVAHEERLTRWLASQSEFETRRQEVRHEAQIVAVVAEVISHEGFDYWDELEYATAARELRDAASGISSAVELNDYEQARQAIDRAGKACAACHAAYRG